jgi:aspartyl-tRNA(Asn)/glutamyl-tRNA(Gln) amidotransferase subunit C
MKLSAEQVESISKLARLDLSEEEKTSFQRQLSSILEYVDKLQAVDVKGVEPMNHVVPVHNVWREDAAVACSEEERARLLAEFPSKEGALLKVKSVF